MSGEVEYAAKTAMSSPDVDISTFINILEDIVDKNRLGRFCNQNKSGSMPPVKMVDLDKGIDKTRPFTKELKCWICDKTGHTLRNCPKKIHAVWCNNESEPVEVNLGSKCDNAHMMIGLDSTPTLHITSRRGQNNLVKMTCGGTPCLVLLDSGAVRLVVSKSYLSQFCAQWEEALLPAKLGKFHSASGKLVPLGLVRVQLVFQGISLVIEFVVMENLTSPYSIVGNDYLVKLKISLLNNQGSQFSIGNATFDFDESINNIQEEQKPSDPSLRKYYKNLGLKASLTAPKSVCCWSA
jgi:hypothetical protein